MSEYGSIYENSSLKEDVEMIKAGHRKNADAKRKKKIIDFAICAGAVGLLGGLAWAFPHVTHRGKVPNFDEMGAEFLENAVGLLKDDDENC